MKDVQHSARVVLGRWCFAQGDKGIERDGDRGSYALGGVMERMAGERDGSKR